MPFAWAISSALATKPAMILRIGAIGDDADGGALVCGYRHGSMPIARRPSTIQADDAARHRPADEEVGEFLVTAPSRSRGLGSGSSGAGTASLTASPEPCPQLDLAGGDHRRPR